MQSLKEPINTPHTQYAAPWDTNLVALQQQLSKIIEDIKHLQQTKRPNGYPTPPGNYRSFWTTDGLVICQPYHPSNQHSQRPSYIPTTNRHNTMGYPYSQDAIYINPSRRPPFPSTDGTDNNYQARRPNIPGQHNNYSNVIQNYALQDRQCLVSGSLDDKPITILIDTCSSVSPLDEQLYYSLSFVPPLQPIQFSVSGADDKPLIALGTATLSIAIDDNTFRVQLVVTRNILFSVVLGINFLQTHDGIISFPTNQL